jgi:hypothetical protein
MNPDPSFRDACRRAWLAAYAEGQLEGIESEQVERWLVQHPEAWADIQEQQALGRALQQMMTTTAPTEPSAQTWDALAQRIQLACAQTKRAASPRGHHHRQRRSAWIAGAVAAGLLLWGLVWCHNPTPAPVTDPPQAGEQDLLSQRAVHDDPPSSREMVTILPLTLVSEVDVLLERVPNMGEGWLPIGRLPLEGSMTLVRSDEIDVIDVVSPSLDQQNIPPLVHAEGGIPLLWIPVRE